MSRRVKDFLFHHVGSQKSKPRRCPSFVEICRRLRNVKYLLMREICAPIVARRIQAVVLRVLTSRTRFSELEPVHQSRSMFRANMGGVIVAVKIFAKQWEHYEERSFNEQIWRIWNPGHKNF